MTLTRAIAAGLVVAFQWGCSGSPVPEQPHASMAPTIPKAIISDASAPIHSAPVFVPNVPGSERAKAVLRMLQDAENDGRLFPDCDALIRARAYVASFDTATRASAMGRKAIARVASAEHSANSDGTVPDEQACENYARIGLAQMSRCGLKTADMDPKEGCRIIGLSKMFLLSRPRTCDEIFELLKIKQ